MSLRFRRGQTFDAAWDLDVTLADAAVADLTGWTGAARLKPPGAEGIALDFAWLDAAAGLARISAAETAAWPIGSAMVELRLTAPSGAKLDAAPAAILILRGFDDE